MNLGKTYMKVSGVTASVQVNEKFFELKGTYRDCRRKQVRILMCITLCTCAIPILREQWMCLECRDTPTSRVTI